MPDLNPFTLAAEGSPQLQPLLRAKPEIASSQDDHGYSLMHAAASYNQLDLLRALVKEFRVDPNLKDEDGETALFVVETVEAAQVLLEELGANLSIQNLEGLTAEEKIRTEGDFTIVADYLSRCSQSGSSSSGTLEQTTGQNANYMPPLPPNVTLRPGSLEDEQSLGEVADPALKQRIEELAARDDFQSEDGQKQLRELIADALRGGSSSERNTRPRLD